MAPLQLWYISYISTCNGTALPSMDGSRKCQSISGKKHGEFNYNINNKIDFYEKRQHVDNDIGGSTCFPIYCY